MVKIGVPGDEDEVVLPCREFLRATNENRFWNISDGTQKIRVRRRTSFVVNTYQSNRSYQYPVWGDYFYQKIPSFSSRLSPCKRFTDPVRRGFSTAVSWASTGKYVVDNRRKKQQEKVGKNVRKQGTKNRTKPKKITSRGAATNGIPFEGLDTRKRQYRIFGFEVHLFSILVLREGNALMPP